jgi:hypothetical protein
MRQHIYKIRYFQFFSAHRKSNSEPVRKGVENQEVCTVGFGCDRACSIQIPAASRSRPMGFRLQNQFRFSNAAQLRNSTQKKKAQLRNDYPLIKIKTA